MKVLELWNICMILKWEILLFRVESTFASRASHNWNGFRRKYSSYSNANCWVFLFTWLAKSDLSGISLWMVIMILNSLMKLRSRPKGHVIAARITAENPDAGFKPNSGKIIWSQFQKLPWNLGLFSSPFWWITRVCWFNLDIFLHTVPIVNLLDVIRWWHWKNWAFVVNSEQSNIWLNCWKSKPLLSTNLILLGWMVWLQLKMDLLNDCRTK